MSEKTIYEQPLNERIRTFLRLEFLFEGLDTALQGNSEQQNRDVIQSLLNLLSVFDRSDLKQEIIKELDRLVSNLSALENSPGVDKRALDSLLAELDGLIDALYLKKSAIGQKLRENDFLFSIRQRSSIPGGTCDFDLPAYHHWLQHTPNDVRKQQLTEWSEPFSSVRSAVKMILQLIRGSSGFSESTAPSGFYQHSLNNQATQMIRIRIPRNTGYFPEISGGKHRFTIRFMKFDINQRAQQVDEDVDFSLCCCSM